jgi:hypothetical protein
MERSDPRRFVQLQRQAVQYSLMALPRVARCLFLLRFIYLPDALVKRTPAAATRATITTRTIR